jgi:ATP-dependent Lhr-like helicase
MKDRLERLLAASNAALDKPAPRRRRAAS